jgi:hypothetical protein
VLHARLRGELVVGRSRCTALLPVGVVLRRAEPAGVAPPQGWSSCSPK